MAENYVICPKDPSIQYNREICEEVFRKENIRFWCKHCKIFENISEPAEDV